jgi:hypothetical protein
MASILGIEDKELVDSIESSMESALIEWGNETIARLRKSLQDTTSDSTSGDLEQSLITLPINYKGNEWILSFQAEDYWKFINKGVRGIGGVHKSKSAFANKGDMYEVKAPDSPFSFKNTDQGKPSYKHFLEWARVKSLSPFAVRESVFRSGIRATHFFDNVVNQKWIDELVKRMEKSGAREIEISLKRGFDAQVKGI